MKVLRTIPRLHVADLKRSIAFYSDVLGFSVTETWPEEAPTFAIMSRDETQLQLMEMADGAGKGTIYIDTEAHPQDHAALQARVNLNWGPEVFWYGRYEYAFQDPDGHHIIVSSRTDEPLTRSV